MRFVAYGLAIESDMDFPSSSISVRDPEVTFRVAPVEKLACDANASRACVLTPGGLLIHWRNVGTFLIRNGNEIVADPDPGVEDSVIQMFLIGPALGILLHQRGVIVLHASVVNVGGRAIGFMGEKGWGKSTTAAAMNARGHALVADDILAVTFKRDGTPIAHPGPPHFKLWPESAVATFGDDPDQLNRVHPKVEKRHRFANTAFSEAPLPLCHLYVLDRGDRLESIPIPPAGALLACVVHNYLTGIIDVLGGLDKNFQQTARLVQRVTVSLLKRPKDLNALSDIAQLVEQNVSGLNGFQNLKLNGAANHVSNHVAKNVVKPGQ
jgi:hypothetical protein